MSASIEITTRFDDYSTRKVTIPNINTAYASSVKPLIKAYDLSKLNGIYVGKDGVSNPAAFESAKVIVVTDTVIWTKEGGLVS